MHPLRRENLLTPHADDHSHATAHRHTGDLGQTAIVAVVAISISLGLGAALLVNTVSQTYPLQQAKAVQIYAEPGASKPERTPI